MKKDQFLSYVKNYTSLTSEDLDELIIAQKEYPYSQTTHNLVSRAAFDNDSNLKQELLHISAIYTTDRSVLKSILAEPKHARTSTKISTFAFANPEPENVELEKGSTSIVGEQVESPSSDLLLETIFTDLENLRKSKLLYEENMVALDEASRVKEPMLSNVTEPNIAIDRDSVPLGDQVADGGVTQNDEIEIAPKQKEQIEIIENYIKNQPGLTRPKLETINEVQTDLSDNVQHFADNVISETLVEILLKQGKKTKAIEVLKKLIWKFPQKKAYFAAQIEDLKK